MYRHIPKKSLGQNFLKSEAALTKIRDAANPSANDVILEIGPGLGALTKILLTFAGKVIAVEKDDQLYETLGNLFAAERASGKLDLIHGDILEFDPEVLRAYDNGLLAVYKLVANIPYNITGAIIEKFLAASFQPSDVVILVQKEVAERIIARDGKESILSIAVKAYGTPRYVATVKAGSFTPAPKVDSAIVAIENISRSHFTNKHHEEVFFQLVKAGFAHKRKMLAGNLKNILEPDLVTRILQENHLPATVRAEDVGISTWLSMATMVYTDQYGFGTTNELEKLSSL